MVQKMPEPNIPFSSIEFQLTNKFYGSVFSSNVLSNKIFVNPDKKNKLQKMKSKNVQQQKILLI